MVHGFRHRLRLDVVQIASAHRSGNGQDIGFPVPPPLAVQGLAELPQEQGEVLLVLRPVDHAGGPAGDGVLPVQVHAVQAMLQEQVHTGLGEGLPAFRGSRRVGKTGGFIPAPQGEDDVQIRVPPPQGRQLPEDLPIPGRVVQDGPSVLNFGEGVVDLGELLRRKPVGRIPSGGGPGGVIAHHPPGSSAPGGGGPVRARQGQKQGKNQDQQGKTTYVPHVSELLNKILKAAVKQLSTNHTPYFTVKAPTGARNRFWKSWQKLRPGGICRPASRAVSYVLSGPCSAGSRCSGSCTPPRPRPPGIWGARSPCPRPPGCRWQ